MSKYVLLDGVNVQVKRVGEPNRCNHCNAVGHIKKECPDKNKACTICHDKYHLAIKCLKSYSNLGKPVINSEFENNNSLENGSEKEDPQSIPTTTITNGNTILANKLNFINIKNNNISNLNVTTPLTPTVGKIRRNSDRSPNDSTETLPKKQMILNKQSEKNKDKNNHQTANINVKLPDNVSNSVPEQVSGSMNTHIADKGDNTASALEQFFDSNQNGDVLN